MSAGAGGPSSVPEPRASGGVAGILLAAGASSRMGRDKLWADLGGRPLVAWPLEAFAACPAIGRVVVAVAAGARDRMDCLLAELGIRAEVVTGGARRQDSVRAALKAAGEAEWVVIHDGARPFLTDRLIQDGLAAAEALGAAIAAVPVVDTIKQVRDAEVMGTLERGPLWAAQTPQVFRRSLLAAAHASISFDVTDDAAAVEATGGRVSVYRGDYDNIKVTTPTDLLVAASLLAAR